MSEITAENLAMHHAMDVSERVAALEKLVEATAVLARRDTLEEVADVINEMYWGGDHNTTTGLGVAYQAVLDIIEKEAMK